MDVEFNDEGRKLYAEISERALNRPIGIFLDEKLISAPVVISVTTDGKLNLPGLVKTERDTMILAIQLNSGVLPVGLALAEVRKH